MKNRIKNAQLIVLLIIAVPICGLLLLFLAFRFLPDTTVTVYNDTESTIKVTLLLQNHDDNSYYLSETGAVQTNEAFKNSIGFDNVRCIYVESGDNIYAQLYENILAVDTTGAVHEKVTVNVSTVNENTCPQNKSVFREGVRNGIYLDRSWQER